MDFMFQAWIGHQLRTKKLDDLEAQMEPRRGYKNEPSKQKQGCPTVVAQPFVDRKPIKPNRIANQSYFSFSLA